MLSNEGREESLITIFGIIVILIGIIMIIFMYCNFLSESINKVHDHRVKIRKECKLVRKISGDYIPNTVYVNGNANTVYSYTSDKKSRGVFLIHEK